MRLPVWLLAPRHLLAWFVVVTAVPTMVLFTLGWRVLAADADLTEQLRQRLQSTANIVASDLRQYLDALGTATSTAPGAADTLFVSMTSAGVASHSGLPLIFVPAGSPSVPDDHGAMALVERAGSLRTAGRFSDALDVFGKLAKVSDEARVFGTPASLEGALARVRLLREKLNQPADAALEAEALHADLARARWSIDRVTFELAWSQIADALGRVMPYPEPFVLASVVEQTVGEWEAKRASSAGWSGRRGVRMGAHHVTVMWSSTGTDLTMRVIPATAISRHWADAWRQRRASVSLIEPDGGAIIGDVGAADDAVSLVSSESGLPWTVRVASLSPDAELADAIGRRRQLQAVLALAALLGLMGVYFVARAVRREVAVAQLQKDFVSAVSHEFRTPLTSMSHLLELLKGDRPLDETRRRRYYDALEQETGRLRQFVDRLLDFGRIESGVARYDIEVIDPAALVSHVVARFRAEPVSEGRTVEVSLAGAAPPVAVDREAFTLVLRNLLENAVKYAPGPAPVRVDLTWNDRRKQVAVRVRDEGPGIPGDEQDAVFQKFVRGAAARASGVRGTGIGLALCREIVRAHGGEIELASEPGRGSTFSAWWPAASGADRT